MRFRELDHRACRYEFFDGEELTIEQQMDVAIDCVRDNCSTIAGARRGSHHQRGLRLFQLLDCRRAALVRTRPSTPALLRLCRSTASNGDAPAEMRAACPTVVNQDLAFGGQNGVMIFCVIRSRTQRTGSYQAPGPVARSLRRPSSSQTARTQTHRNHLTPIFTVPPNSINTFPYTGQYGEGMTGPGGWQAEQELQAQKLINYVTSESNDRPAVILGDMNAGLGFPADDIVGEGEETFNILAAAYVPAYTAEYLSAPLCTFCSTNLVTNPDNDPEATSVWIDHIFVYNLDQSSVSSTSGIFDQDVVPVEGDMLVPLSDHFGMRSVIAVP